MLRESALDHCAFVMIITQFGIAISKTRDYICNCQNAETDMQHWIVLGDTRVNTAAQVSFDDSWQVCECLTRLFKVHTICEPERSTGEPDLEDY